MLSNLLPLMPPCLRYVEEFGGGASVLLNREPVEVETYNDLNSALADFFRVVADPDLFSQFKRRVEALPVSRELWREARATWEDETDRVRRVAKWFVVARQSFGGWFGRSVGFVRTTSRLGKASPCSLWLSCLRALPEIHARIQRVQVENNDWRKVLRAYDTPETLHYLDPPYVASTRKGGEYKHEMTDDDHAELVEALLSIEGMAVLSGYPNETYKPLERAGWERRDFKTACYAAGRTRASGLLGKGAALAKQARTESVWRNPAALAAWGAHGGDMLEHVGAWNNPTEATE